MLSQADLQTIATVFNMNVEDVSGAISSQEESPLNLRLNGTVRTQQDWDSHRESGIQQGKEIGSKELARALEITIDTGEKDPAIIAEKLKTTLSSQFEEKYKNMTPTEEMEELRTKLLNSENSNTKLNETLQAKLLEIEESNAKYSGLQNDIIERDKNSEIRKFLKDPEKSGLSYDQQLALFKMEYNIDKGDNGFIPMQGENIVMNPTGQPETVENVVKLWLDNQSFTKSRSGMGGGDRGGAGYTPKGLNDDEAYKYMEEKGIDPMSQEGSKTFMEITSK
jgi:hypothetical protein